MEWESLSPLVRATMDELGNFRPTIVPHLREVKGRVWDDDCGGAVKTYYTSADLRRIASACTEVADWLDKRADEASPAPA